jgi:basic membrane protein A and related proteins
VFTLPRSASGLLLALVALLVAACGSTPAATEAPAAATEAPAATSAAATEAPAAQTAAATTPQKFVYVTPSPIGVNDFLILGQKGLEEAAAKHGATSSVLESEDPTSREENVRAAIADGATVVMVLGFEFGDIIPKVASESPDVQFLIVDQCIDNPPANVHCAVFREYEAAYLIGVQAGLLTKSNKVGVISAIDIPFLHRYTDGFAEGARAVNPQVEVSTLWIGTDPSAFADPARAKEQALALAAQGVDHIFAAGAASNLGIFEAAKEQGFFSYGVDVNQCPSAPGQIVDNLLKRVDVATVQSIDAIMAGQPGGLQVYGLKEGGIGVVPLALDNPEASQCEIMNYPDVIARVQEYQDQIISGELTLQDPMFQ